VLALLTHVGRERRRIGGVVFARNMLVAIDLG
jgi:hypothetical protein